MLEKTKSIRKCLMLSLAILTSVLLTASCTTMTDKPPIIDDGNQTSSKIEINILGATYETIVDNQGRVASNIQVASDSGTVGLSISKNTIFLDTEEKPIHLIELRVSPDTPSSPQDAAVIGPIYTLMPQEAVSTLPIKLTIGFNPDGLPEDTKQNDTYIAFYEDGQWKKLPYKQVDVDSNKVTTQIDRFTSYAVLAPSETDLVTTPPDSNGEVKADRVDVVYFHRAQRCRSCIYAEDQTVYTLETYFMEELSNGKITFQSVNVQDENNIELIEKYGAYASQLYITTLKGDSEVTKEVLEFWEYIGDDEGFSNMIITKIKQALEA